MSLNCPFRGRDARVVTFRRNPAGVRVELGTPDCSALKDSPSDVREYLRQ
jgi:hypothetical protein